MLRISEVLVALLVAYGFASLGDTMMQRASRGLADWNLSFLVGASVAATLLFPLSLLLPGHALIAMAALVAGAGALRFRGIRLGSLRPDRALIDEFTLWRDVSSVVFMALIGLAVIQFVVQNGRLSYLWDGYQIWATKALILYHHGGLTKDLLIPGKPDRLAEYPPLVPLYEALVALARGEFEWNSLKPVFAVFYVSMLISTWQAARQLVSRRLALAATALLALLPAVSTRLNVGGYADMPQAAFVAGFLAAVLSYSEPETSVLRSPAPWILTGMMTVKNEGSLLLAAACGGIGFAWLTSTRAGFGKQVRKHRHAITLVLFCVVLRRFYVAWVASNDPTYGPIDKAHIEHAFRLLAEVPVLCFRTMLNTSEWALFWPAFLVAIPVVLVAGTRIQRSLVLGTTLALAAYTAVFFFTNWDVRLHIDQAYNRLLTHICPAAAITLLVAYSKIAGKE